MENTPIINALKNYINTKTVRFHMPGHKGRYVYNKPITDLIGQNVFAADVTNIPGMDDLHQAKGVIEEAQKLAASAFGADYTYFLINGTSCGLQALILSTCNPGEEILVPRNIHRSILSGIILSGAIPIYFMPERADEYGIPTGVTPETISRSLTSHPNVKAVLVVSPTYHGIASDLAAIAGIVHEYGIPLLVDEAHGAHLHFHSDLPKTALEQGADASVQGTHKILSAFTQASMLHIRSSKIDQRKLEATLRLLQSTSTSYLLLASLDAARQQIATYGEQLIQNALDLAAYLRNEISKIFGFSVLEPDKYNELGFAMDPTKITVSVRELNITGLWTERWLRENCNIQVEMSEIFSFLLLVSLGNIQNDADRIIAALEKLSSYMRNSPKIQYRNCDLNHFNAFPAIPELALTPREAFNSPVVQCPLQNSAGKICAEIVACYPPGIPAICSGEKITTEMVDYLMFMRDVGIRFHGCFDPSLQTIYVIM